MKIFCDIESYSTANLKKTGAYRYAADPSTEVLCLAYKVDDQPAKLWVPGEPVPEPFTRPGVAEYHAWNSFFEMVLWQFVMAPQHGFPEIPHNQWRDTMALSAYFGLPLDLFRASRIVAPDQKKDRRGSYLISVLCKPVRPTKARPWPRLTPENCPELFAELYDYCKQDVVAERAVHDFLPRQELPPAEQAVWLNNIEAAFRGAALDMGLVVWLQAMRKQHVGKLTEEFRELTGYSPTQPAMITNEFGLKNCQAGTIEALLEGDLEPRTRRVLEIRQAVSKTSLAKLDSMEAVSVEGRAHGMQVYYGAHTGRYAGRLIQLHNLPQGDFKVDEAIADMVAQGHLRIDALELLYDELVSTISTFIRGCMICTPGRHMYIADYSSIEARVLAWIAGEDKLVERFRQGADVYIDAAKDIYGGFEDYHPGQRPLGKVQVLGCGFGMGKPKFYETCLDWGVDVDRNLSDRAVDIYREKNKAIVQLWDDVDKAFKGAIRNVNRVYKVGKCLVASNGRWLFAKLPSGRTITYPMPAIQRVTKSWGDVDAVTYMGIDSYTRQWKRKETWGGSLVENLVQGIARDIMCGAELRLADAGFDFLFSVHDEIVSEADEDDRLEEYERIMNGVPHWARGMPIGSEGVVCQRFRK